MSFEMYFYANLWNIFSFCCSIYYFVAFALFNTNEYNEKKYWIWYWMQIYLYWFISNKNIHLDHAYISRVECRKKYIEMIMLFIHRFIIEIKYIHDRVLPTACYLEKIHQNGQVISEIISCFIWIHFLPIISHFNWRQSANRWTAKNEKNSFSSKIGKTNKWNEN